MLLYITRIVSYLFGRFAQTEFPTPLQTLINAVYTRLFNIDYSEAVVPAKGFRSLALLFTRSLKHGTRQICQETDALISPVDGTLRQTAYLKQSSVFLIKGQNYSISDLCAGREEFLFSDSSEQVSPGSGLLDGTAYNLYLSPQDYHHIHAPVSGVITKVVSIPGCLLPVNDFTFNNFSQLFCRNERVIIKIDTESQRTVILALVGALNVGSISLDFLKLRTNLNPFANQIQTYTCKHTCEAGSRLATFNLGSSVLMIDSVESALDTFPEPVKVKYGQKLR